MALFSNPHLIHGNSH